MQVKPTIYSIIIKLQLTVYLANSTYIIALDCLAN
jgi:hypothetical protein